MSIESVKALSVHQAASLHTPAFMDKLIRGFTHKMNNVLAIFEGYSSLILAEENLSSDIRESVEEIRKGSAEASRALASIYDSCKISAPEISRVSLLQVLNPMVNSFSSPAQFLLPEQDSVLNTDSVMLQGIFQKILQNACEACDQPDQQIVIEHQPAQDNTLEILITDTGCGIRESLLPDIFAPFITTKKHLGNLGMGLTIASHQAALLQGEISIASQQNLGTCVRIRLPR